MGDDENSRREFTRRIFMRLSDPGFAKGLEVTNRDGSHPIVIALLSDSLSYLVDQVSAHDGGANVAVPIVNGFYVLSMRVEPVTGTAEEDMDLDRLDPACTVGAFVQRVFVDGESTWYRISRAREDEQDAVARLTQVGA